MFLHTRKPPDLIGTKADQITPKQPGAEIGQRKRLSEKDVEGLNEYYECGKNFVQLSLKKIDFLYAMILFLFLHLYLIFQIPAQLTLRPRSKIATVHLTSYLKMDA